MLCATALLILAACNNSEQATSNATDTTANNSSNANTTSTTSTPTSTTVTTPQNMLVVRHKVANYEKWKTAYDGHDSARVAAGLHNYVIGRGEQDSNTVMVALKIDDTTKAMAFGKNPSLKEAMKKGGVMGQPSMSLITMVYQDTATIPARLRSVSMFTVKDWDAWLKNFQDAQQERSDNGLVTRAYGHDASDTHKVVVVTALADSAKAMAYFKSDALKKRIKDAGVEGQLNRFIYWIAQKY